MAVNNPLQRQPTTLDYARPTQFRFDILKVPNVQYMVTEINLPGIAFSGDAIFNTRLKPLPFMGDTLDYTPLEVSFVVQEDLKNWREIYDWMTGIGFPQDNNQFATALSDSIVERNLVEKKGKINPNVLTSDATLTILTNKNNALLQVNFRNIYPTSLSSLQFDTKDTDSTQLTASVTFNYDIYDFVEL